MSASTPSQMQLSKIMAVESRSRCLQQKLQMLRSESFEPSSSSLSADALKAVVLAAASALMKSVFGLSGWLSSSEPPCSSSATASLCSAVPWPFNRSMMTCGVAALDMPPGSGLGVPELGGAVLARPWGESATSFPTSRIIAFILFSWLASSSATTFCTEGSGSFCRAAACPAMRWDRVCCSRLCVTFSRPCSWRFREDAMPVRALRCSLSRPSTMRRCSLCMSSRDALWPSNCSRSSHTSCFCKSSRGRL
mmetsp:Transcript_112760/g.313777  ORF Transcript_112760/g.313777 Transcript_112760/m.313777 type:complete len:251 (+) Transcript_112760:1245-1997(+)